eukprot:scaffold92051_cov26-Tisochrysis_lutea.AAC.1
MVFSPLPSPPSPLIEIPDRPSRLSDSPTGRMPCSTDRLLAEAMAPCTCERCAIQRSFNRYGSELRDDVSLLYARANKAGGGGKVTFRRKRTT